VKLVHLAEMQVYDGNAVMMVEGSVVVRERWLWRTKLEGGYQRDTAARVSKMIRRDCRMPSEWFGELDMQVVAYCWSIPSPLSSLIQKLAQNESCVGGWIYGWTYVIMIGRCGVDPREAKIDMCLECESVECGAEMAGSFSLLTTAKFQCSAAEIKRVQSQSEG